MKEERFPHPGNPPHQLGDQPGQKGRFRGSEESAAIGLQQAEQKETSTDGPGHLAAHSSLRCASVGVHSGWVLKLGFQRTDLGRGLGLAAWRRPKGAGVWPGPQMGVCTG